MGSAAISGKGAKQSIPMGFLRATEPAPSRYASRLTRGDFSKRATGRNPFGNHRLLAAVAVAVAASNHEAKLKRRRRYVTYGLVVAWAEVPHALVVPELIPAATVVVVIVISMMSSAVTGFRRGR